MREPTAIGSTTPPPKAATKARWAGRPASEEDRDAVADARAFQLEVLAGRPVPVKQAFKQAAKASIAKRTVERAKATLGIRATRRSDGNTGEGEGVWALPSSATDRMGPNASLAGLRITDEASSGTTAAQDCLPLPKAVLQGGRLGGDESEVGKTADGEVVPSRRDVAALQTDEKARPALGASQGSPSDDEAPLQDVRSARCASATAQDRRVGGRRPAEDGGVAGVPPRVPAVATLSFHDSRED